MATPLSATQILQIFREGGVSYVTRTKWSSHTRTSAERPWGPVHGVMIHHTGPYTSERQMLDLLWNGYAGLPGPLCLGGITKGGEVHMTGYGRCNHAGGGDPVVLDRVIEERTPYPRPKLDNDDRGAVDGNRHFYGFELINRGDGKDPWPAAQLEAAAAAAAAICRKHGWSERSVIGHKEWQRGKPDPTFDMEAFRRRVKQHMKAGGCS
jgi:hypothetical protein